MGDGKAWVWFLPIFVTVASVSGKFSGVLQSGRGEPFV